MLVTLRVVGVHIDVHAGPFSELLPSLLITLVIVQSETDGFDFYAILVCFSSLYS